MKRLYLLALVLLPLWLQAIPYKVRFIGINEKKVLQSIKDNSDLVNYQDRPPPSINALRFRAESDLPRMIEILHSYGYYDAQVTTDIEKIGKNLFVSIYVYSGPKYLLSSYDIYAPPCEEKKQITLDFTIPLQDLGLALHQPATAEELLNAELKLLTEFASYGYPLASIEKREVFVDVTEKSIKVEECIDQGPLSHFGYTTMTGIRSINPAFLEKRITWKEGEVYDLSQVEETQRRLLDTHLFSSVLVSHAPSLDESGELPMKIVLSESKHRSFNIGLNYATVDGPGATVGWTNRNVLHRGQLFHLEANASTRYTTGVATYMIPDVFRIDQDYYLQALAIRERVRLYLNQSYIFLTRLERIFSNKFMGSLGAKVDFIHIRKSIDNGNFIIFGFPLFCRLSTTDSLLNPTSGYTLSYKLTPYLGISPPSLNFLRHSLTGAFHIPVTKSKNFVVAIRGQLASVLGASINQLPMNKRLFGGSDDDLRGYRYKTVSPKDERNELIGGRSAIYWTLETRFRVSEKIGIVPFTDWGNVSLKKWPTVHGKWFKSVGIGLRYFAFFGPLRVDIGFPLTKRKLAPNDKNFDPTFRVYMSIGQTF